MSRIRTIKPDFWTSEQVMECSPNARLLFIGLWNFCDDAGRHPMSPKQIKAQVFPGDSFTPENVRGMLDELSSNGLIRYYTVEDKDYFVVTGWSHQRIDKAQPAKYPAPIGEHPESIPRTLATEGKGEEWNRKGKEGKGKDDAAQQSAPVIEKEDRIEAEIRSAAGERAPDSEDLTPIFGLLEAGYDFVRDIVPVVRERAAKATKPIASWRYFVPAIEEAKAANGAIKPKSSAPSEPVEWLPDDSPQWGAMNERSQREKHRPLLARGSSSANGIGAFVPTAWLDMRKAS